MNDNQWPPAAPSINKDFKRANDATKEKPPSPANTMVTKMELEKLEEQRKKAAAQLHLRPRGMKSTNALDQKREQDIERMRKSLRQSKEKTRNDFERSQER